ncbi:MAG: glycine cleavage system protein GcvH [Lachnospirales bacterium]
MSYPKELKYRKSHEWVKFIDETTALIGISNFAQEALGGIVFVSLPDEDSDVTAGTTFTDLESVKAVSDIYSPVTGTIAEVNEELADAPEMINDDPYGAWLVKVVNITETEELMDADAYAEYVENEAE